MPDIPKPPYFERLSNEGGRRYLRCTVCPAQKPRLAQHWKEHESTRQHLLAVETLKQRPTPSTSLEPVTDNEIVDEAFRALLVSGSPDPTQPLYPDYVLPSGDRSPSPSYTGLDWNRYLLEREAEHEELTPMAVYAQQLNQRLLDLMNGNISDYEAGMYHSDDSSSDESLGSQHGTYGNTNALPQKRARAGDGDPNLEVEREWFPWPDRVTWSLDILMHLPRSVFSRKQLDLFLWLLRINNVPNVPSSKSMKTFNNLMQNMCGIDTLKFEGKLGHTFYMNSLPQILAQEMCNPKVREHLRFYPEDTGKYVSETRQASNWLNEVSPDETTPMIRLPKTKDDYYIYEPAMLNDGTFCIPFRWYEKKSTDGKDEYWGRAWRLHPKRNADPTQEGWVVRKDLVVNVSQGTLLKNFPCLSDDHQSYNVPHPSRILGVHSNDPACPTPTRWTHTNPVLGNRWRALAKGHRVLSVPLMTYCDDTSGNQSKKWNEHNSFLFTLAGLPREEASKEYNIHFLCTSNIAPPLEMLDGVVQQLEDAKREGIWAWDCIDQEPALLIPTVPSLLGDNPMQSEFACHIGAQGKYFCRMCMVKGTDVDESKSRPAASQTPNHSPTPSIASDQSDSLPPPESVPNAANTRSSTTKKTPETMEAMVRRISDFIKIGIPRTKSNTQTILSSFLDQAKTLYSKARLNKARTETGVKDTFQLFFLDRLLSSYQNKYGTANKQQALDQAIQALPDDIKSPVWRLGLDPHQDTPVEILHVVLLGFVKYFWRDLVQNQVNDTQKVTLIARLNSLDVQGLGIPPLGGKTLVTYAGSLTGRDFRAIAQVAPFVIHDLVPEEVYEAWVALSTLIPLIWQPVIKDIDQFCTTLETEIQNFLIKTVKWSCAWFNKSKFHILLHLPNHIRRFGPAILFATEAFESFNAVIRAKSVHSNRQAPSRDIALGFAQGNRVRHLMSGGLILPEHHIEQWRNNPPSVASSAWRPVGPGPRHLMDFDPTPSQYLGLSKRARKLPGNCKSDKKPPRAWHETLTGKHLPHILEDRVSPSSLFVTGSQVTLQNEDTCLVGGYVIATRGPTFIAKVQEILQLFNSNNHKEGLPDGLLLQTAQPTPEAGPLPMPRLSLLPVWNFVELKDVLCTVNVQHDCRRHQCHTTGIRYVVQERTRSQETTPFVQHISSPDDLFLNTAQMRDAVYLQAFRQASTRLTESAVSNIIHDSVTRAIDVRKAATTAVSGGTPVRSRGRGRGRGAGRGRGRAVTPLSPGESIVQFT